MTLLLGCLSLVVAPGVTPVVQPTLADLPLSAKFRAPEGWRFLVTRGPPVDDPRGDGTEKAPGEVRLCLTRDGGRTCRPALDTILTARPAVGSFDRPHYLLAARIVRPLPARPVLLVQAASLPGGNGDRLIGTMALAYDRATDTFVMVYSKQTGSNNNQEVRGIDREPLRGAIVSAEPTADAPYAFWITVNRLGAAGRYVQALRYRSATRYGDGNPLAVIDSEMPGLQRRLGLWKPGAPLPVPDGSCGKPRLKHGALWCG
ncbi:hypothetical protein [uncultured Sphingomonas sp.]|uniref:hypothetical protein n=1 Tax=uncultured Sphingomonas sp. TaxID=158754 RepID=UPI0025F24E41|nr:hypothetical protein [uncultured Sphingomonas sp.]